MNKIEVHFLKDKPEAIPTISKWIWKEWTNKKRTLEEQEEIFNKGKNNTDKFPLALVAFLNGELAGTISIVEYDIKQMSQLRPWVSANYVKKEFRNSGVSSELLSKAEEIAKEIGISKIYLGTETVPEFYFKRGYKKIDEVYFKGEKTEVFEKNL